MVVRASNSRLPAQAHDPLGIVVLELAQPATTASELAAKVSTAVPAQALIGDLSLDLRADLLRYALYLFQSPRLIRQLLFKQLPKLPSQTLHHLFIALVLVYHSHVSFQLFNYSRIRRQPPKS